MINHELPQISRAQADFKQRILGKLSPNVYRFLGTQVFLRHTSSSITSPVKVSVRYRGTPIDFYVNLPLVNAYLTPYGLQLENMSQDAIAVLLSNLSGLPDHLELLNISLEKSAPTDLVLEVFSYETNSSTAWMLGFQVMDIALLESFFNAFKAHLEGMMVHPLADLPITLPLITCTLTLPATTLSEIGLGDVLLLGGV